MIARQRAVGILSHRNAQTLRRLRKRLGSESVLRFKTPADIAEASRRFKERAQKIRDRASWAQRPAPILTANEDYYTEQSIRFEERAEKIRARAKDKGKRRFGQH